MNTRADRPDPAAVAILLGCAWLERGQDRVAAAHLERALSFMPDHPEAHRYLAYVRVRQGEFADAVVHMDFALRSEPADSPLRREAVLVRELAGYPPDPVPLPSNPAGRLRFTSLYERTHHRSGWRYAVEALYSLHNPEGVRFEGFLEDPFAWQHPRAGIRPGPELLVALRSPSYETRITSEERHIVPFREPWVGFLHNPPHMPPWFHFEESPQTILAKPVWQESLRHCVGLFALSEYAAGWLRRFTGKPVSALLHPTEMPDLLFDFQRFQAKPQKFIIQVGWWLRRLGAIDRLPIPADNILGYTKLRLVPHFFPQADAYLKKLRERNFLDNGRPEPEHADNTIERQHLSNDDYDRLLAENIVFLDLYDAGANNAVIECLARATPLLVNRLPAVEEYLGAAYPLYYSDLAEAAAKALDLGRLREAHLYLLECETRRRLDADSFRRSVEESEVYQKL
ncbi:MAG: tetratricopeptide repeat protein [Candidatus Competibacteraceae bacterium]